MISSLEIGFSSAKFRSDLNYDEFKRKESGTHVINIQWFLNVRKEITKGHTSINAINLSNILNHKEVTSYIP
jgi:hypothetical protein